VELVALCCAGDIMIVDEAAMVEILCLVELKKRFGMNFHSKFPVMSHCAYTKNNQNTFIPTTMKFRIRFFLAIF